MIYIGNEMGRNTVTETGKHKNIIVDEVLSE